MDQQNSVSRNLHDLSQIVPDAEITNRAIQRAQSALDHQPIASISHQRAKLVRLRNIASLAAAAVVLFLLTAWLSSVGSNGSIAFAQVQAQVEKTKSVQYVQTRRDVTKQNQKAPVTEERVMVLGNLQRKEFQVIEPGDDLPDGASWATATEKIVTIYDPEKGKMLNLLPERKGYSYVKGFLSINPDDGKVETEELKPSKADFYKQIRDVPRDKAKQLPAKTVDDKSAVGFFVEEKIERKTGIDTWKRTYWVDEKTKLPIRIEVSMTSTVPMHGNSKWVIKDIVFDAPLDAKLFSLDPPDGYQDLAKLEEESPKQQLNAGSIAKALVFAEIVAALQAELEKAKSLQYNSSWTQTLPDGKRLPAIVHQTKILGNQLKRTETIDVKPGDIEADFSGPFGRSIEIVDLQKKKKAALYPEIKGYMVMDWDGTFADAYIPSKDEAAKIEKKLEEQKAARDKVEAAAKKKGDADKSKSKGYTGNVFIAGKSSLEGAKPHAPSDIFELILHVPTDKAKQLPAKKIGDKDVVGFQVEQQETHKDITTNWRHTWWVDPKTKLPVQLEILNNNPHVKDEKIISDIAFDAPLDSSLFSIEMPADYIDIEKARAQSQPVKHDPNQPPTLRFTQVENLKTKDGKQAPELVKQVTIWANNLRREEVTLKAGGDDQLAVANGIRSHVRIQDTKQKKSIVLLPDKKEYLDTTKTAFTSDYDWLAMQSASDGKPPQLDIFGALQIQPKNLKRLPLQTIDGKLALGQVFEQEFERKAGTDTWQRTQWRDLFTSQPIRIEAKFRSTDPSLPDIDWVMRDFVEGVPVDRAQFSLDPPEGYTLQKK